MIVMGILPIRLLKRIMPKLNKKIEKRESNKYQQ